MALTIYVTNGFEVSANGTIIRGGARTQPKTITATTGTIHDQTFITGATQATTEILRCGTSAGDDIADFDFLMIESSLAGTVSFEGDTATDNSCIGIIANIPLIFSTDDTTVYTTTAELRADAGSPKNKTIKKVYFRQGTAAVATVRVVAIT